MDLFKPKSIKRLSTHSGRLERWLGKEKIEQLSNNFLHGGGPNIPWYGPPVNLSDVPGSVWICGDGDFVGDIDRGFFSSAADSMADHVRMLWRRAGRPIYLPEPQYGVGFTGIADAITRMAGGYEQYLNGNISKTGVSSTLAVDLWTAGTLPAAGAGAATKPGGTVPTTASTGALGFNAPSGGTLHLIGADLASNQINKSVMIYDYLFGVLRLNGAGADTVTGVPTRYQSGVASASDYIGGNFLAATTRTTLVAAAHTLTGITYNNQEGASKSAPDIVGNSASPAGVFDMPANTWFGPLASGDVGIKNLTSTNISLSFASGALDFIIAHPIGIMCFPQISQTIPFDWLTMREQAPRIFDNACLSLLQLPSPAASATTYNGTISAVNAP